MHPESGNGFTGCAIRGIRNAPATQGVIFPGLFPSGGRHRQHPFPLTSYLSSVMVGLVSGTSAHKGAVCGLLKSWSKTRTALLQSWKSVSLKHRHVGCYVFCSGGHWGALACPGAVPHHIPPGSWLLFTSFYTSDK